MTGPDVIPDEPAVAAAGAVVVEDFDAFWAQHEATRARPQVRIRGREVPIPDDLPLGFATRVQSVQEGDEDSLRELIAELYGGDALDHWIGAGMRARELMAVLAWSVARAQGLALSFAEALARAEEALAAGAAGDPPPPPPGANRATRRAAAGKAKGKTKTRSAASGG